MKAQQAGVQAQGLTKSYPGAGGAPARILDGVSLSVCPGESLAIVGPSGSGKSTLLNILGTLDRADSGVVRLGGEDVGALGDRALSRVRSRQVGFVFQLHHLLPQCTVLENALVPALMLPRAERPAARRRAEALLGRVGLGGRHDARPGELSGGERQRVAVVRALANGPGILLADEPTGALDEDSATALVELLVELVRETPLALVMVTHALALARRLQRVERLARGHLSPWNGDGAAA